MAQVLDNANLPMGPTRFVGRAVLSTVRACFYFVLLPFLSFLLSIRMIRPVVDFIIVACHIHYGHNASLVSDLARVGRVLTDASRSLYSFLDPSLIKDPGSLLPLGLRCLPFDNFTTYRVCVSATFVDRIAERSRNILVVPAWDELLILGIFSFSTQLYDVTLSAFEKVSGITALREANALQTRRVAEYRRLVQRINELRSTLAEARETRYDVLSSIHRVKTLCEQGSAKKRSLTERIRVREAALSKTQSLHHELQRRLIAAEAYSTLNERFLEKSLRQRAQVLKFQLAECLALDDAEASAEAELCHFRATRRDETADATRASSLKYDAQVDGYTHVTKTFEEKITLLRSEVANVAADIAQIKDATLRAGSAHNLVLADTAYRRSEVTVRVEEKQTNIQNLKEDITAQAATNAALSEELSLLITTNIRTQCTARTRFAALATTAGKNRLATVDRVAALEGQRSQLLDTLRVVRENTAELNGSLEFTTVAHLLHMHRCATARAAAASELTSLQSSLARTHAAREALEAEGAPLRAKKAEMEAAQKAGTAGLEARLAWGCEAFAGVASARRAAAQGLADARHALAQAQHRSRAALRAYQCARDVDDAFADGLIQTSEGQKTRAANLEAMILALNAKKSPGAGSNVKLPAEKSEATQDGLADEHEALSAGKLRLARLREELAAIFDSEEASRAERDDVRLLTKRSKAGKGNDALRQRPVGQRLSHRGRMAAFEGRLEGAVEGLIDGPSFSPPSATALDGDDSWEMPEFVQGSSRSATPERMQSSFRRDGSYPSTPSLTFTLRSTSCSPFNSPITSSPILSYVLADPADDLKGVHPPKQ